MTAETVDVVVAPNANDLRELRAYCYSESGDEFLTRWFGEADTVAGDFGKRGWRLEKKFVGALKRDAAADSVCVEFFVRAAANKCHLSHNWREGLCDIPNMRVTPAEVVERVRRITGIRLVKVDGEWCNELDPTEPVHGFRKIGLAWFARSTVPCALSDDEALTEW